MLEVPMLTTFEVVIFSCAALLLPLALFSLAKGSPAPQNTILSKYYAAERHLNFVGNLFLVTVCANAIARLALHFGVIDSATRDNLGYVIGIPFGVLLVAFLALWIKAAFKIRRAAKATA
jgi:hypothetical protein